MARPLDQIRSRVLPSLLAVSIAATLYALPVEAAKDLGPLAGVSGGDQYEQALESFYARDYEQAVISLHRVLREDPNNLPSKILLARTRIKLGNAAAAVEEMRAALAANADRNLALPILGEAYLQVAKFDELLDEVTEDGLYPEAQVKVLDLRAKAWLAKRKLREAETTYRLIRQKFPESALGPLGLASLALVNGDYQQAEASVQAALELDPENPDALYLRGDALWLKKDYEAALEVFNRGLELDPDHIPTHLSRAGLLIDVQRFEDALDDTGFVLDRIPHDAQATFLKSQALRSLGQGEEADQLLLDASAVLRGLSNSYVRNNPASLLLLGLIETEQGNWEAATEYLARFVELKPFHVGGRKLYGQALLQRGQPLSAASVLEPLPQFAPNDPAVFMLLADLYRAEQRIGKAIESMARAIELRPDDPTLKVRMASLKILDGKNAEGVKLLLEAVDKNPDDLEFKLAVASMMNQENQHPHTLRLARQVLEKDVSNIPAMVLVGNAQLKRRHYAESREAFERVLQIDSENAAALLNLAKLDMRSGEMGRAIERIEFLLRREPSNYNAMQELALAHQREGNFAEAIVWLEKVRDADENRKGAMARLIDLYLTTDDIEEADKLSRRLVGAAQRDPDVMLLRAKVEAAQKNLDGVHTYQRKAASLAAESNNLGVLAKVARLQTQSGDLESAIWTISQVLRPQPEHFEMRLLRARIELQRGRLAEAKQIAESLLTSHPKRNVGHWLLGDVALLEKRFDDAVERFRQAHTMEPSSLITRRLYRALAEAGKTTEAGELLQGWVKRYPGDIQARRILIGHAMSQRDWDVAIQHLQAIVSERPQDGDALNNLAWAYYSTGDDRAIPTAQDAILAAPNNPGALDTLGWLLVNSGEPERGLKYLREASSRNAADPSIRFHVAYALAELGRDVEAKRELKKLRNTEFPEKAKALSLLESLGR